MLGLEVSWPATIYRLITDSISDHPVKLNFENIKYEKKIWKKIKLLPDELNMI